MDPDIPCSDIGTNQVGYGSEMFDNKPSWEAVTTEEYQRNKDYTEQLKKDLDAKHFRWTIDGKYPLTDREKRMRKSLD